ncbi:hypothetical protein Gbro_4624 [Gordonia bronchialis DSM 43247]|uniref:Uncharacterized protein n=1 Tax=Gordonia bronchialis (strain ATCC 25592 / DSM 43247 / BCRC 13721 / JCM 3198 / KCTC 3076 / NBRC 16047 / NCTC 10667) TaxID=526226 RepID=D0L7G3_GORB4|nr:hypothetical protein Gbro_4624 [Gordonia bronchialis DSM 43247]STQ66768.1 Uncharacterised protein [Gordonia bronchialis]
MLPVMVDDAVGAWLWAVMGTVMVVVLPVCVVALWVWASVAVMVKVSVVGRVGSAASWWA